MSARLAEVEETPPTDLEALVADVVRREVARQVGARMGLVDRLADALYRSAVLVGRAIKPGKRWDGL